MADNRDVVCDYVKQLQAIADILEQAIGTVNGINTERQRRIDQLLNKKD